MPILVLVDSFGSLKLNGKVLMIDKKSLLYDIIYHKANSYFSINLY